MKKTMTLDPASRNPKMQKKDIKGVVACIIKKDSIALAWPLLKRCTKISNLHPSLTPLTQEARVCTEEQ